MPTNPATTVAAPELLLDRVGSTLGSSGWLTVRQGDVDTFARVTRDEQWIHVDPERAAAGPFGTTIAHGYLTLSLCSHLLEQIVAVEGTSMAVNYGLDRVRFPAPVRTGDRLRGHGTLRAAAPVDEQGDVVQAVIRLTVEIEGGTKPACVADTVIRFYRETPHA